MSENELTQEELAELELLEQEAAAMEAEAVEATLRRVEVDSELGQLANSLTKKEVVLTQMKSEAANLQRKVEEEEECIANNLMRHLDLLQKEKDKLAIQVMFQKI